MAHFTKPFYREDRDLWYVQIRGKQHNLGKDRDEAQWSEARHVNLERSRIELPPDEAKGKKRWRAINLTDKALAIVQRLLAKHPEGSMVSSSA